METSRGWLLRTRVSCLEYFTWLYEWSGKHEWYVFLLIVVLFGAVKEEPSLSKYHTDAAFQIPRQELLSVLSVLAMFPLLRSNKAARLPGAQSQLGSKLCLTERFLTTNDFTCVIWPHVSQFTEALTKYPKQTTQKWGKVFGFTVSEVPVHDHLAPLFLAKPPGGRKRQLQNHDLVINFL